MIHEYDINSAYPDVIARLPCMLHGKWRWDENFGDRRHRKSPIAIVKYRLGKTSSPICWGPFPFRESDGSISFPVESGGGWVWFEEWREASELGLWPNIDTLGAWVFDRDCDCAPPFAKVAHWYLERLRVGKKTGPGQAYKLGYNSGYGKFAQSIGRAPFQHWAYAGMITAGCRAKALSVFRYVRPSDVLAFATDGILTRCEVPEFAVSERLGEWTHDTVERVFLVRPGITFGALEKTRGLGLAALRSVEDKAAAFWEKKHDLAGGVSGPPVKRFCGIKLGVRKQKNGAYVRSPRFCSWYSRPVTLGFDPLPKRDGFDGTRVGKARGLKVRRFPLDQRSVPYKRSLESDDARLLRQAANEAEDQPDGDADE